jgi:hypothetical protein
MTRKLALIPRKADPTDLSLVLCPCCRVLFRILDLISTAAKDITNSPKTFYLWVQESVWSHIKRLFLISEPTLWCWLCGQHFSCSAVLNNSECLPARWIERNSGRETLNLKHLVHNPDWLAKRPAQTYLAAYLSKTFLFVGIRQAEPKCLM